MSYKFSILYPDKGDIEYPDQTLSESEVVEIAKNYPWLEQLKIMESLPENKIFYSPSLEFTCIEDNHSLTLTAVLEQGKVTFSLWYHRPILKKTLFGRKEKMEVVDKGMFDLHTSLTQLEVFLQRQYPMLEKFMTV